MKVSVANCGRAKETSTQRLVELYRFFWGRLSYRLAAGTLKLWDLLLVFETLHWMQLGKYNQYEAREPGYEKLPAGNLRELSFAIVTPSYNQAEFLEQTMLSVLGQDYPLVNYAVVDGGSMDGSFDIIARHAEGLAYHVSERDQGQTDAIIKGFKRIEGDICAYLNSDDLLAPGTLALVADYFSRHPEVDVVYGDRIIINAEGKEVGRWILPQHDNRLNCFFDYIPQETMFWRRSLYDRVGGLDPSFHYAMDWDLILRFQDAGAKFQRLPYFLACFRAHTGQKSQNGNEVSRAEVGSLLRVHGGDADFGREFEKAHKTFRRRAMVAVLSKNWRLRK